MLCLSNNKGSLLALMLHVHIAEVTPKATETPEDKFADEVQQYPRFEGSVGGLYTPPPIPHSLRTDSMASVLICADWARFFFGIIAT